MIKHINRQFVVLHTCTQTLFHTRHSEMHKKSLDAPITIKDNTLFNLFGNALDYNPQRTT